MNKFINIIALTYTPVKKRHGAFIFPDDPHQPITPEQIDELCDRYHDMYGVEPSRQKLAEYAEFTQLQAQAKILYYQERVRLEASDPSLKGNRGFRKAKERQALRKLGYAYYKPRK